MEQLRKTLYDLCTAFINSRLDTAGTALAQAREGANDDTKSSAGDKFETTREMMQQEIERNKRLLMDAQEQQHVLQKIESATASATIKHGSIVCTDQGNFFISVSAGQLVVDGKVIFAISPSSPIAIALAGKKVNDTIAFNGKSFKIEQLS